MILLDPEQQKTAVLREEILELFELVPSLSDSLSATEWLNATRIATRLGVLRERARKGDKVAKRFFEWSFFPSDWKNWLRYA